MVCFDLWNMKAATCGQRNPRCRLAKGPVYKDSINPQEEEQLSSSPEAGAEELQDSSPLSPGQVDQVPTCWKTTEL